MGLERAGPGLLLRDLEGGRDPQVAAAVAVLSALDADVLVLTGFDQDAGGAALGAFRSALDGAGQAYPYAYFRMPNRGVPTGLDLDHDGSVARAGDAQGWGHFPGAGGMAVLSRLAVDEGGSRDFSALLWADLPWADLPPDMGDAARRVQRLSSTGHWDIALHAPSGGLLHLLVWHATPPVFDGPEDRNGRRNHDEAAFWSRYLDGEVLPDPPRDVIVIGDANLDPQRGEGRTDALLRLLHDPRLSDPVGPLPTAGYDPPVGPLRLDYLLPSAGLRVVRSGVMQPAGAEPALAAALLAASHHWPVWADLVLP